MTGWHRTLHWSGPADHFFLLCQRRSEVRIGSGVIRRSTADLMPVSIEARRSLPLRSLPPRRALSVISIGYRVRFATRGLNKSSLRFRPPRRLPRPRTALRLARPHGANAGVRTSPAPPAVCSSGQARRAKTDSLSTRSIGMGLHGFQPVLQSMSSSLRLTMGALTSRGGLYGPCSPDATLHPYLAT